MIKRICILSVLLILAFSASVQAGPDQQVITIDAGSFVGFMGFSYEWIDGLQGYKGGIGITDPDSFRIGFAYKYYFPEPSEEEVVRSRVSFGPDAALSFENISDNFKLRTRLGVSMGYDFSWGTADQYLIHLRGGLSVNYPAQTSWYSYNIFSPTFNVSFGYKF